MDTIRRHPAWAGLALATALLAGAWQTVLAAEPGSPDNPVLFGKSSLGERPVTQRNPPCPYEPGDDTGKPDCFAADHDSAANAMDIIVPYTITVPAGAPVTYEREGGRHIVMVFAPGTDIETLHALLEDPNPATTANESPYVLGNNLIKTSAIDGVSGVDWILTGPVDTSATTGWTAWTTPSSTFGAPGKYLVVCGFVPHLLEYNMVSYVNVD